MEKKLQKMNIGFVWLKINDFPNIPSFQHSIIPKDVHPSFQQRLFHHSILLWRYND